MTPAGFTTRPDWADTPRALIDELERALGAHVVGSESVQGGMSPGPAALLSLDDGRRVFAKAVAASVNSRSRELYDREWAVLRRLPDSVPHARLLARADHDDWIVLATRAAEGSTLGPPWHSQDVAGAVGAVSASSAHRAPTGLPPAVDRLPDLEGWRALGQHHPGELSDVERERFASLTAMSDGWRTWTAGNQLVHLDVRCDNAVAHGEAVWLVDWAAACAGAGWIDEAMLALDAAGSGHVGGERVGLDVAHGILARLPYEATRFVVAWIGMLRRNSLLPPWPALPTYRAWQAHRAQALQPLLWRLVSR